VVAVVAEVPQLLLLLCRMTGAEAATVILSFS
jgi:hypothetical protein